jgi:hypothetical protein
MDTSRRIDCYLGTLLWLLAIWALTSHWWMAVSALTHELKSPPLCSLFADSVVNTFYKGYNSVAVMQRSQLLLFVVG